MINDALRVKDAWIGSWVYLCAIRASSFWRVALVLSSHRDVAGKET